MMYSQTPTDKNPIFLLRINAGAIIAESPKALFDTRQLPMAHKILPTTHDASPILVIFFIYYFQSFFDYLLSIILYHVSSKIASILKKYVNGGVPLRYRSNFYFVTGRRGADPYESSLYRPKGEIGAGAKFCVRNKMKQAKPLLASLQSRGIYEEILCDFSKIKLLLFKRAA